MEQASFGFAEEVVAEPTYTVVELNTLVRDAVRRAHPDELWVKGEVQNLRKRNGHTWEEWGAHANHYLEHLEGLVWPKLFVLGGGITKNPETWLHYLHPRTPIVLAQHINNAGIVGAADATRPDSGASHTGETDD